MEYQVVPRININKKRCERFGAFLYDRTIDGIYLDMPWWFPVQIGFTEGLKNCQVTPMFLKMPFLMKGWINQDILLRQIELLKLALSKKILMHASCIDNTLIVGFPNSGKTYQTYKSVKDGATLISEEYTIISYDETELCWLARPYKPIMRTCFSARTLIDCGISTSFSERLWLLGTTIRAAIFPFMYEAVIWKNIPVSGKASAIKKIVYGSSKQEVKDWKMFAILCENEFPFMSSELLQAYALASGLDLLGIQAIQRGLIKNFVESIYSDGSFKD